MICYRVSKYDPKFRVDGKFTIDDWTSISDVGNVFSGHILTMQEYKTTEQNYIDFVKNILQICSISELEVVQLEKYKSHLKWKDHQRIKFPQISSFMKDCLREKCWAKLEANDFYIYFGYDYYMYFGTTLNEQMLHEIGHRFKLFVEKWESP